MRMRYILLAYPKTPLGARLTYKGNAGEKPTTQILRIVLTSNRTLVYNCNMIAIRGGASDDHSIRSKSGTNREGTDFPPRIHHNVDRNRMRLHGAKPNKRG